MAISNSLNSGVNGIKTFSKSLEVIGDNIANVNTTGFKGSRVTNQDSFSQTLKDSAASGTNSAGTNSMQVGSGSSVASISQRFSQGVLNTTGGPSDLGISGKGFFKVLNPSTNEHYFTRAGDFKLDDEGNLMTNNGFKVLDIEGDAIVIPPTKPTGSTPPPVSPGSAPLPTPTLQSFQISKDGSISAFYSDGSLLKSKTVTGGTNPPTPPTPGGQAPTELDCSSIGLTVFANPNALMRAGDNLFSNGSITTTAADSDGPAGATTATTSAENESFGNIIQGTLELSNVDLTEQFSDLIVAQRAFQANSRIVTVSDSVLEEVVNLKR